ncbi:MAG: VapC toxin family PIN domain ribonuclease [Acidobacteria bacterium]|nr:MAG: VapC toxin family PIN domain ribonuclease [Acidobacteriota bacterium]
MIFIDTGAFVARYVARDQYHSIAVTAWGKLAAGSQRCFTTNHILDETLTLLARRAGNHFAAERARSLFTSNELTIIRTGRDDEMRAVDLLEQFADQPFSFTDCLSYAVMKHSGISMAFTFDNHFRVAGFEVWPG